MEQDSPWTQVVSLLSVLAGTGQLDEKQWRADRRTLPVIRKSVPRDPHQGASYTASNKITSIERQSNNSVLVSWCDPTMCHYVDQVWSRVTARRSGYCALTGQRIERGHTVFKPCGRGRQRPVNCDEMILATAVAPTR